MNSRPDTASRTGTASKLRAAVRSHRIAALLLGALVLAGVVVGAALFQPWRLFTSSTVNEELPGISVPSATAETSMPPLATTPPAADTGPALLRSGTFVSQEHATSGSAHLLRLPDGSHIVRLEDLASSDGPDVKVWLSSLEAGGDWFKYRSGQYLDLGPVKATHGNQNYTVPAGVDVSGLTTVVLWCDRFSVAFGSAPLA
ncbi:DM13 domain-containing protein [Paenarthrobacter sp. NPDC092416]|uniref:DM13 domain-containing protein n=1 Tax=Paenarthrobacter sp. NPDC092416 TaxID=3364386 RepID=UPI0038289184